MRMDNTQVQAVAEGTGWTIPLNVLTLVFLGISKITLADGASLIAICSGAVGTLYVAYKWRRDIIKAKREDEEYEEEHNEE